MPIEIRELVIKASVTAAPEAARPPAAQLAQLREEMVRECLERVLEQLAQHGQR